MINVADESDNAPDEGSPQSASSRPRAIPVTAHKIDSRDLFIGTREVAIHHGGEVYRLRLTGQNKLILTK